jgi:hypothetical protein
VFVSRSHFDNDLVGARVFSDGWCHLAFVYDFGSREMRILHNGEVVAKSGNHACLTHPCALRLGLGTAANSVLEGKITELRYDPTRATASQLCMYRA